MFPRLCALVLALALLCALTLPVYAEDPVSPTPTPTPAPTVSAVMIDPSTPAALDVGKNLTLTASVTYDTDTSSYDAKLDRTVTWTSSDPSIATVDDKGVVSAVAPGKAKITAVSNANKEKSAECEVTVSGITLSKTNLTLLVGRTESLTYSAFGAAADKGIVWTTSNPSVAEVFGGTISAHYEGTATITATANATGYTAECSVTVKKDEAEAIRSSVDGTKPLAFSSFLSTLRSRCADKTDGSLSYLSSISVSPTQGVLYYGYVSADAPGHGVGGSEKYYVSPGNGQEGISDISFVAASDFSGTAEIAYTGYASNGGSFHGTILVNVSGDSDVTYTASADRALAFTSEEFIAVCQSRTGRSISYLTFDQPSAYQGALYYDYSAAAPFSQQVRGDTRYYITSNPSLDRISFVPAAGFTGRVTVPYRCTDSSGGTYNGKVTIQVSAANGSTGSTGDVRYSTARDRKVTFSASDFNDVSLDRNGYRLNYIYLSLPASLEGTLYYDYSGSGSYASRVSDTTRYYRGSSPQISRITFVPAQGFTGTVSIPYTGYDRDGGRFTGTVRITVGSTYGTDVVRYTIPQNGYVRFNGDDFNDACFAITGERLNYVRFDLPAARRGTLYSQYNAAKDTGSELGSSVNCYRGGTGRLIDDVTFVPAAGFSGLVTVSYTGRSSAGSVYNGTVEITVGSGVSVKDPDSLFPFNDARPTDYFFDAVSWAYYNGIAEGVNEMRFGVNEPCTRGQIVTYLWRVAGSPTPYGKNPFGDVFVGSYCYDAVLWAYQRGITNGTDPTTFSPNKTVTRGQAMTYLHRFAGSVDASCGVSFTDVSPNAYYAPAIRWAVTLGITNGTTPSTFSPDAPCTKAQIVTFLYRFRFR